MLRILFKNDEFYITKKIIEHPNFNPKNIINGETYLFSTRHNDIQILLASKGVDPTYIDSTGKMAIAGGYYLEHESDAFQKILQQKFLDYSIPENKTLLKKIKI